MEEEQLLQRCNMCWQPLDGTAYRTTCNHIFCERCTYSHFQENRNCPACDISLNESDFMELVVGVDGPPLRTQIFQQGHKDPKWSSVCAGILKVYSVAHEYLGFSLSQMYLDAQRMDAQTQQLMADNSRMKQESGKNLMQYKNQLATAEAKVKELDHKLRQREKELTELMTAYKEKARKCQAWEKTYAKLKAQVGGQHASGNEAASILSPAITPPISPSGPGHLAPDSGKRLFKMNDSQKPRQSAPGAFSSHIPSNAPLQHPRQGPFASHHSVSANLDNMNNDGFHFGRSKSSPRSRPVTQSLNKNSFPSFSKSGFGQ